METVQSAQRQCRQSGMSYKFQRLREKIRRAVESGELAGKLPGERELARRFKVNAKTLSKALTDLAAEGLLHRSIGRGTFVKGAETAEISTAGAWLLLADADTDSTLIKALTDLNPQAQTASDVSGLRPSYLNQFSAVIDLAAHTPESFLRDLLVRGVPVVAVGREPRIYSTSAVLLDVPLGVGYLARDLVLAGHRQFLAVEPRGRQSIVDAIRHSATRYCSDLVIDACTPEEISSAMEHGATACICASAALAAQAMRILSDANVAVPQRMSVAAVGWGDTEFSCTGYFVAASQKAAAVAELLRDGHISRPTTLWLAGSLVDCGTTAHAASEQIPQALIA